jgi:hypothetical protein
MPVDTDSDLWDSASPKASTKTDILEFLKSNPNQAFTAEEVSREVLDADFEIDVPQETLPAGEMVAHAISSVHFSSYMEAFVTTHLSALVYEGEVEVRVIPTEREDEEVELGHYTIRD